MINELNHLNSLLVQKKESLKNTEENNKTYLEYKAKYNEYNDKIDTLNLYMKTLSLILDRAKIEDNNFKQRRLLFIEEMIKSNLDYIFPLDNLNPKLELKSYRGKNIASLKFVDKNGKTRSIANSASGLMKQLITFTGSMSVCKILGCNKIFIDEAFGASSPENKSKIGKIIDKFVNEDDIQVVLISQGVEIYQDIVPRREIHLEKKNGRVVQTGGKTLDEL